MDLRRSVSHRVTPQVSKTKGLGYRAEGNLFYYLVYNGLKMTLVFYKKLLFIRYNYVALKRECYYIALHFCVYYLSYSEAG